MTSSQLIDNYIAEYKDWRGEVLIKLREIIHDADDEITEEWKWNVPVFTQQSMICALSAFKNHVKINFFKGAQLKDPHKIINAGFESKQHRSLDFRKGDIIPQAQLKDLIKEALRLNKLP